MKRILERFFLERSEAFKVAACFCLLGLVAAVDYATGVEISVSAFYPLPVVHHDPRLASSAPTRRTANSSPPRRARRSVLRIRSRVEVDRLMYEAKERGKNASGHPVK
jgi:hypothetical protein